MGNWWIDNQGVNNLKGVLGDLGNRIILPDDSIVEFMLSVPIARRDFKLLVPTMLPEEQARLNELAAMNPRILEADPCPDPGVQEDRLMRAFNTPGFHDPNRRKR